MVESTESQDYLGVMQKDEFKKMLNGGKSSLTSEPVLFSGKIKKINMF